MTTNYTTNLDTVMPVIGELNFATVPGLSDKYQSVLQKSNSLVIDLASVTTMDTTGLALLVVLTRQAKSMQKKVVFINLPPQVLALVEALGVHNVLPIKE